MAAPMASERRPPSEDGAALWRRATADVKPLARRGRKAQPAPKTPPPVAPATKRPAPVAAAVPAPPTVLPKPPPELSHGTAPGLDRRTAERMKRGRMQVEARIDLHGMTQAEAHRALAAFLADSQAAGRRCVLVITGKGTRGEGVLRAAVPRWLNEPPERARVLSFSYAHPRHGGAGALYILLRRRR